MDDSSWYGGFETGGNFRMSSGGVTVDPRLIDILETAASISGYNVTAFSGVAGRAAGTGNHPGGYAVDLELEDATTGLTYSSYSGAAYAGDVGWQESFPVYEEFAQIARVVQEEKYPELSGVFRWGGYFNPGRGNKAPDMMHFDINPSMNGAMGGGSWDGGATNAFQSRWGISSNGGLGNAAVLEQAQSGLPGIGALGIGQSSPLFTDEASKWLGSDVSPIQIIPDNLMQGGGGLAIVSDLQTADEVAQSHEIMVNAVRPEGPAAGMPAAEAAPVPMPGRPPDTAKTDPAPAEQPQTVRIGKNNYVVGQTYETGGRRYVAQADGTFMDLGAIPTGEPTVMSGVIGQKIGEAATAAGEAAGQAWDNATTSVQGAASDIGTTVTTKAGEVFGGIGSGLTGLGASLGNLFGGAPPADGITITQTGWRNGRPVMAVDQTNWIPSPAPIPEGDVSSVEPVTFRPYKPAEIDIALPTTTGIPALDKALESDPILVLQDIHDDKETAQVQAAAPAVSTSTVTPTGSTEPPPDNKPASGVSEGAGALATQPSNWADFSTTMDTPSVNDPVAAQPVTTQTVTEVVPNPEYTDWAEKYGQTAPTPEATATLNDIHDERDDATIAAQQSAAPPAVEEPPPSSASPPASVPRAPPKTVVKTTTVPAEKGGSNTTYSQPIYVSAVTGEQLYEQVVYSYDADTNTWGTNTVYKETPPDPNAPVPYTPKPPTMTAGEIANAQMGY